MDAARYFSPKSQENPNGLHIARPGTLRGEQGGPQAIYPLFSVFAYRSDADRDEAERLEEQVPGGGYYLRVIGVLNKGVWSYNIGRYLDENEVHNSLNFLKINIRLFRRNRKKPGRLPSKRLVITNNVGAIQTA